MRKQGESLNQTDLLDQVVRARRALNRLLIDTGGVESLLAVSFHHVWQLILQADRSEAEERRSNLEDKLGLSLSKDEFDHWKEAITSPSLTFKNIDPQTHLAIMDEAIHNLPSPSFEIGRAHV